MRFIASETRRGRVRQPTAAHSVGRARAPRRKVLRLRRTPPVCVKPELDANVVAACTTWRS